MEAEAARTRLREKYGSSVDPAVIGMLFDDYHGDYDKTDGVLSVLAQEGRSMLNLNEAQPQPPQPQPQPQPQPPPATSSSYAALASAKPAQAPRAARSHKRKQKRLFIIRGLPGSGKSTLAGSLGGVVFSTDDFFVGAKGYKFDPTRLGEAHQWNQKRAKQAMRAGKPTVVIDNTNTQAWEMHPYAAEGSRCGYKINIIEPGTAWKFDPAELARRNKHGVPRDKIEIMLQRYERHVTPSMALAATSAGGGNHRRRDGQPHSRAPRHHQQQESRHHQQQNSKQQHTQPRASSGAHSRQRAAHNPDSGDGALDELLARHKREAAEHRRRGEAMERRHAKELADLQAAVQAAAAAGSVADRPSDPLPATEPAVSGTPTAAVGAPAAAGSAGASQQPQQAGAPGEESSAEEVEEEIIVFKCGAGSATGKGASPDIEFLASFFPHLPCYIVESIYRDSKEDVQAASEALLDFEIAPLQRSPSKGPYLADDDEDATDPSSASSGGTALAAGDEQDEGLQLLQALFPQRDAEELRRALAASAGDVNATFSKLDLDPGGGDAGAKPATAGVDDTRTAMMAADEQLRADLQGLFPDMPADLVWEAIQRTASLDEAASFLLGDRPDPRARKPTNGTNPRMTLGSFHHQVKGTTPRKPVVPLREIMAEEAEVSALLAATAPSEDSAVHHLQRHWAGAEGEESAFANPGRGRVVVGERQSVNLQRPLVQTSPATVHRVGIATQSVSSRVEQVREEAAENAEQARVAFRRAAVEFKRNNPGVAAFYAEEGRRYKTISKQQHDQAAELLIKTSTKVSQDAEKLPLEIDLHFLRAAEAVKAVRAALKRHQELIRANGCVFFPKMHVITGRGLHSTGGKAKIKPAVEQFLNANNFAFTERYKGCLDVRVASGNPL